MTKSLDLLFQFPYFCQGFKVSSSPSRKLLLNLEWINQVNYRWKGIIFLPLCMTQSPLCIAVLTYCNCLFHPMQ